MENLRLRYGDRVDFVKVYVSEAHPTDEVRFDGRGEETRGQRMIGYYRMIHKAYTASPHTHDQHVQYTHKWKVYSDIDYCQPQTLEERLAAAKRLLNENTFIGAPLFLDSMGNDGERVYAAHPERLYVISPARGGKGDEGGKVLYKGAKGPFGYQPEHLGEWLEANV